MWLYLVKLGVGELTYGFLGASLCAEDVVGEVVDGGDTALDERLAADEPFSPLVEGELDVLELVRVKLQGRKFWEEVTVSVAPEFLHGREVEGLEEPLPFRESAAPLISHDLDSIGVALGGD